MLRWNTFRAQRYLRSRFNEGSYALASEVSDVQLEMLDYARALIKDSLGDVAIGDGFKPELYRMNLTITNVVVNVLTVSGSDLSILSLLQTGDKLFEGGVYRTTVTSTNVGLGQITVASATGLAINDSIEILTSNCVLIKSGEAWLAGLPFDMRSGKDSLVSGSTLGAGTVIVPGGGTSYITMLDEPEGRGKLIRFSTGGSTPSGNYTLVIQAQENNVTNLDDPFLKNANIPEATGQKMRLQYRIAVVPTSSIDEQPIPYTSATSSANGNLTNRIMIDYQPGSNGSVVSMTPVSGSQAIDGRDLEILVRNNPAAGSPVGNPIPTSPNEQAEFTNGKLIDSLGQTYHLNQIITSGIQVILRVDKEVGQEDPVLSEVAPYYLVKRDVYVTDDAGTPSGKLFFQVGSIAWDSADGFIHASVVQDLRKVTEAEGQHQETTTSKFNLSLVGGGLISAEPGVQATGVLTLTANTFVALDEVEVNGVSFVYTTDWVAGIDEDATAVSIAAAINASTDPLIANIVDAQAVNNTVEITAVATNASGNSITTSVISGAASMSFANANLTGGLNGTVGELVWASNFQIINPNGPTQTIPAGNAVLKEASCVAYEMDLENGGTIAKGVKAVTSTSNGATISFSGAPDLSDVELGNILLVGTESTVITAVDSANFEVTVNPALVGAPGSAEIFLDTYAQGYLPKAPQMFVLAVKSGTQIKIKDKTELDPGESTTSGVPTQLLTYIGATSETDSFPNYINTAVVNDGDSLTLALGKLDEAFDFMFDFVGSTGPFDSAPEYTSNNYVVDGDPLVDAISSLDVALDATDTTVANIEMREVQNNTAKLIEGGTWHWNLATETLSWSANAYIQIADLSDVDNTIVAGNEQLLNDGEVISIEINRVTGGPSLITSVSDIAAVAAGEDTYLIARRVGNDVLVGKSFLLKDGEYLELDGALAEINRKLGQLKVTEHESNLNRVRISSADIVQLDGTTLSQELNNGVVSFAGAVIDFDSGDILEIDDVTVIDTFTPFSIPTSEYLWYGIALNPGTIDSNNAVEPTIFISAASASDAVAGDAPYPNIIGSKKLGLVQVYNNAGSIEVVALRRFGVGSGSGGGSGLGVLANLYDPLSATLPTGTGATIDGEAIVNGDVVLFSNLGSNNNRVYEVAGVGVSLSWTPLYVFSGSSLDPSTGETVTIREGDSFALQVGTFDGTTYKFNDYVRYFSGVDYFEQSSLKTMVINNNDSEVIYSVSPPNNENMIMDFSIKRGTVKENNSAHITYINGEAQMSYIGIAPGDTGVQIEVDAPITFDTWTDTPPSAANNWNSVVWSPELSLFAAVASSGTNRVMYSSDGISWNATASATEANAWTSVTYSPSLERFVAVSFSGTNRVMYSDNGTSWTAATSADEAATWSSVTWSPSLSRFVAVATSGVNRVMYSANGISWTSASIDSNNWRSITWSPELALFVAVAELGTDRVAYSLNGISWTSVTPPEEVAWRSVTWSPELLMFVAVAQSGTNRVMYSYDGIVWSSPSSVAPSSEWKSVTWSPELGVFVAVGAVDADKIMYSSNGLEWTVDAAPSSNDWSSVTWAPQLERFVAVANAGASDRAMYTSAERLIEVTYTSDNSGSSGVMKYSVKRWGDAAGGPGGIPNYATSSSSNVAAAGAIGDIQYHGGSGDLEGDIDFKWDGASDSINLNGLYISKRATATLLDNTATMPFLTVDYTTHRFMIIEYSVDRNGDYEVGTLLVTNNGATTSIVDTSTFTVDPGITFTAVISGSNILVRYTTTNTGFNGTLSYSVRRWT